MDAPSTLRPDHGTCQNCTKPITALVRLDCYLESLPGATLDPGVPHAMYWNGKFCSIACATVWLEGTGHRLGRKPSDF